MDKNDIHTCVTELNNAKRMRATSRFWNENKDTFAAAIFVSVLKRRRQYCIVDRIASEIHLLDCLARKEQDEITIADLKQYSVVKITLMTRYLDD